jgi:hypothetical protein
MKNVLKVADAVKKKKVESLFFFFSLTATATAEVTTKMLSGLFHTSTV